MKPIISLKNVSVVYDRGESAETTALHNISLEIFDGEYIVFFGPSGCGKSTLLYTIAGLESPTSGEVMVAGQNMRVMPEKSLVEFYRTTIGMVFQAFYLVPHLTAKDNLILSKMFSGVPKAEREDKAKELCERFGITEFADRKPSMMSGGQQQRTAIARALMNDPHIILADEPVGNLDSKNAGIVLELLASIHSKEKKTVIQVTHNANDIHYADRVFYMKDGAIEKIVTQTHQDRKALDKKPEVVSVAPSHMIMKALLDTYKGHLTAEQEERLLLCIEDKIKGEISDDHLQMQLDAPFKDGGVGLNSRTALHFREHIISMLK
ncbi:ABC transporter ATP-binding protein [Patescibacteria group bacterium]|nr:ABC transporter ATP-binding protein [Patescibacteria group bacterium]